MAKADLRLKPSRAAKVGQPIASLDIGSSKITCLIGRFDPEAKAGFAFLGGGRQQARGFKDGSISLLVATDVASRGLHIEEVSHVFNYDLPQDPEDYVHRIGRTARAGASGKAISLACERYVYSYEAIEEFVGYSLPFEFPAEELLAKPKRWTPRRVKRGGPGGARGGPGGSRGGGRGGGTGRSPGGGGRQRRRRSAGSGSSARTD